ncbi:MAG TPA: pilin [Candidatus Saccharimonadales bacterium]|nr:pilin [Candidatus Saccharimonadales bacterium]
MRRLVSFAFVLLTLVPMATVQARSIQDVISQFKSKAKVDCTEHYGTTGNTSEEIDTCRDKVFNKLSDLCNLDQNRDKPDKMLNCFSNKYDDAKDKTGIFTQQNPNTSGGLGSLGNASSLNIPAITFDKLASNVIGTLGLIAAAISTIYLVLGGIKYSASNGDPQNVASAKRTITYAITGLVISILATTIVAFVLGRAPQ